MDWYKFYSKRVNSTYQEYFNIRYAPFLEVIDRLKTKTGIQEVGCGIGSVSKAIGGKFTGFDIDEKMVELANINTNTNVFQTQNAFKVSYDSSVLKVSHGVLEHFTDNQLRFMAERCRNSIHYVPLDKYEKPSFGDERLLPVEFWLDIMQPNFYKLFNDDHDLMFIL